MVYTARLFIFGDKLKKIKILSVGESSYLHSGYGRYNNGLLTELHKNPNYDLYEFGLFFNPTYNQAHTIPWKYLPNCLPQHRVIDSNEKLEEWKEWCHNPINNLGGPLFNSVVLEIQPDIIIANNDEWNLRYIIDSPFRRFFKLICLFACDSSPQKPEWIDSMSRCDGILTYSEWGKRTIEEQSPKVKVYASAPPVTQPEFQPLDKVKTRESFGLPKDWNIIGTVMRNQPRKLFPLLFSAFKKYLDRTENEKTYLWAVTRYPDNSWNIPALLAEYGILHRVLFTYCCIKCGCVYPSVYQDSCQCPNCHEITGLMPGTSNGISSENLCRVYNCFDILSIVSNSEGYGCPIAEAASCAIPQMVVDYSAMEDFKTTLGSEPIRVSSFYKEMSTGQDKAVPDEEHLIELWTKFFNKPAMIRKTLGLRTLDLFQKNYSWEKTANVWNELIEREYTPSNWSLPLRIHNPAPFEQAPQSNTDFARWLINDVAGQPEKLSSIHENEIIRNLIYQCRANAQNNGVTSPYNREMAYSEARSIGEFRKHMELARGRVCNVLSK